MLRFRYVDIPLVCDTNYFEIQSENKTMPNSLWHDIIFDR